MFMFVLWVLFLCVSVLQVRAQIDEPVLLFFSNSPEYVKSNGYLISGTISQFTPTMIYFYHLNDSNQDKKMYLRFKGNCEAFVSLTFSSSKENYFRVGNDVGLGILKNSPQKIVVQDQYIFEVDFYSQNLLSGFVWVFSNGRIDFESWVHEPNYRHILPQDNKHVKGIFGMGRIVTYLPTDMNYMVVGDIPLSGIESNMLLKGTYKVFYHFVVNRQVSGIVFSARGGPSIPMFHLKSKQGDFIYTSGGVHKPYDEKPVFNNQVFITEFICQPLGACYYPVYYRVIE
ncbi:MAG: hypothetical protein ABDH21_06030 [bacterium]